MALMHGGDLNAAYAADGRTVFQPTVSTRAKAAALEAAAGIGESLQRQLERVSMSTPSEPAARQRPGSCASPWGDYCESVAVAVEHALAHGQHVLAISQPRLPWPRVDERHRAQQQALAAMLRERFAGRPGFRHVDLTDAIDLRDPSLRLRWDALDGRG